jgi:predicted transcriptional regulator
MDTITIKIELLKLGIRQKDIAEQLGVSRQAVNDAIKKGTSKRIQRHIQNLIDERKAA